LASAFFLSLGLYSRLRRVVLCLGAWTLFLFASRRFVPFARNWLLFLPIFMVAAAAALAWVFEQLVPARKQAIMAATCSVIVAVILAIPVLDRGSILASTETGVLKSAPQIADFIVSRNIPPEEVFRNSASDLPLHYYWWRRTGSRAGIAIRQELEAKGVHQSWFLLNTAYRENLGSFSAQHGFRSVLVLDEQSFDGAILYHVRETQ